MNNIPSSIRKLLNEIRRGHQEILQDNLVGIYVHGSIAMGCFNPASSDIDFLVVVKDSLDNETKKKVIDFLLGLSESTPKNGLEMSIVLQDVLKNFTHPTSFELHYSNEWKQKYTAGEVDYTKPKKDPDLAAHFTITKKRGICLTGKPISEIFFDVPEKHYVASIVEDSEWSLDNIFKGPDEGTCEVPVYTVLNLCRVLAFLQDKLITSKREGGEWGLANLPEEYKDTIQQALNTYNGNKHVQEIDCRTLKEFGRHAQKRFPKV